MRAALGAGLARTSSARGAGSICNPFRTESYAESATISGKQSYQPVGRMLADAGVGCDVYDKVSAVEHVGAAGGALGLADTQPEKEQQAMGKCMTIP